MIARLIESAPLSFVYALLLCVVVLVFIAVRKDNR